MGATNPELEEQKAKALRDSSSMHQKVDQSSLKQYCVVIKFAPVGRLQLADTLVSMQAMSRVNKERLAVLLEEARSGSDSTRYAAALR